MSVLAIATAVMGAASTTCLLLALWPKLTNRPKSPEPATAEHRTVIETPEHVASGVTLPLPVQFAIDAYGPVEPAGRAIALSLIERRARSLYATVNHTPPANLRDLISNAI